MADNIDEIMGCGKISLANVTKLIKKRRWGIKI